MSINDTTTGTTTTTGTATPSTPVTDPSVAQQQFNLLGGQTGYESSLSNWAGPYVTNFLGQAQALANTPYEAYMGPLTAGASNLQTQAFEGIGGLQVPQASMGTFTPRSFTEAGIAEEYMNPFLREVLDPQIAELRRQSDIARMEQAGRLTKAGAYGGGRQAVMEAELERNLLDEISQATGSAYRDAYDRAASLFGTEQERERAAQDAANRYGFDVLQRLQDLGTLQRDIEAEGVKADIGQFEEEKLYPYKQIQFLQSLLQGLPTSAQDYTYTQPSQLEQLLQGGAGIESLYSTLFGGGSGGSSSSGGFAGILGDVLGDIGGTITDWFTSSTPDTYTYDEDLINSGDI
jgi:hypothetical protein